MSYSSQPPIAKTGAPGEPNCSACHTTPSADYNGFISLKGIPAEIIGNQTYTLTLNVVSTNIRPEVGGFELVVLDSATNNNAGSIELLNFTSTSFQTSPTGKEYVGHKNAMPFANSDTIAWTFNWTAPSTATSVVFYSAALLANNQGGNNGDNSLVFTESHAVSSPLAMEVVIDTASNPACFGGSNGFAHASVINGMQPYSYIWSTGDSTSWVYNLTTGEYTVTVTDANNNMGTQSVTIGQPDEIIPVITATSLIIPCGDSVTLHGSATGGTGPLTFSWNNGASDVDSIIVSQSGYYCLVATDTNNCQANVCVGVNFDQNGVFCNGISADTITCNNPSVLLYPGVTANDTITYNWTGPNGFLSNDTVPQITEGGIYTLVATIPTGCSCTSNINVVQLTDFEIQITELTPTSCYYIQDGTIEADVISGEYEPFTTDPPNFNGDSLAQGSYMVTVTNGVGCTTTVDFVIEGPDSIHVTPNIDHIIGSDPGSIDLTTTGGVPDYVYFWSPIDSSFITGADGSLSNITTPGDYSLVVSDSNDCSYSFGPYTVGLIDYIDDVNFSNSISISPNPASDFILIIQKEQQPSLDVLLYNIHSQLIGAYHFSEKQNKIDISNLPKGIYQIILTSGNKLATKQIILR